MQCSLEKTTLSEGLLLTRHELQQLRILKVSLCMHNVDGYSRKDDKCQRNGGLAGIYYLPMSMHFPSIQFG